MEKSVDIWEILPWLFVGITFLGLIAVTVILSLTKEKEYKRENDLLDPDDEDQGDEIREIREKLENICR